MESTNISDEIITLWPQHLLCMCCLNGGVFLPFMEKHGLKFHLARIKKDPDIHIRLDTSFDEIGARTNTFDSQSPEERKRDLDVLQKLGLVPGSIRTGRVLYQLISERIPSLDGICRINSGDSSNWQECPLARAQAYADGKDMIINLRSKQEMAEYKKSSCAMIADANHLSIRAHHLLCLICFKGGDHSQDPLEEDNLYEIWEKIEANPNITITVVEGCSKCMICPPCDGYDPQRGLCVQICGLKDRRKDLAVMQKMDILPGMTMTAREIYKLIFDKISDIREICYFDHENAPEWKNCATHEKGTFDRGIRMCQESLKLK